jgi:glycolate oxidase iron-sulfur subunit
VAILAGCAQSVLDPGINATTERLLARFGIAVAKPKGEGCCGALTQHMGREADAMRFAKANIDAWDREIEGEGLDAIIITTSGCGTTIKDYGHMFKDDPVYAEKAAKISSLAKDITEYLATLDLPAPRFRAGVTVAYHSACSLQHGQKVTKAPKDLLAKAGFVVKEPAEGHLCCGSAGTYNIMQSDISTKLRDRKVGNIERTGAVIVAAGNIGCITHIASASKLPVLHTVELLEWAYGGVKPEKLN